MAVKGNSLKVLLQYIYCDNTNCVKGMPTYSIIRAILFYRYSWPNASEI